MAEWKWVNIDHVPFCEKCHSILEPPDKQNLLRCTYCDYAIASKLRERKSVRNFDTELKKLMNKQINQQREKQLLAIDKNTENSNKDKDNNWIDELESDKLLREKLKKQIIGSGKKMITEECLQCGAKEMAYEARQLRSVDEGQTIFYECLEC
eukprot:379342_1